MSLHDHARAARSMAEAFAFEANECGDDRNALLLTRISAAYSRAAGDMEGKAGAEIKAIGGGCTLDHSQLKRGQRCLACQS